MNRTLWPKVKAGDWVIYADVYGGVHKAKILEVDITLLTEAPIPGGPSRMEQPYGLTKDTGTVRILYDTTETIENLADLVTWSPSLLSALARSWDDLQAYIAAADTKRDGFQTLLQEYRQR